MTPALLKLLTPHVDHQHLVKAEIRENIARIDEISARNYRLAMEYPDVPEPLFPRNSPSCVIRLSLPTRKAIFGGGSDRETQDRNALARSVATSGTIC